jgi:hypothetical protein
MIKLDKGVMSKVADSVKRGLKEAIAYADGKSNKKKFRVHGAKKIDVKAIRLQRQFFVIKREPRAVQKALHAV